MTVVWENLLIRGFLRRLKLHKRNESLKWRSGKIKELKRLTTRRGTSPKEPGFRTESVIILCFCNTYNLWTYLFKENCKEHEVDYCIESFNRW